MPVTNPSAHPDGKTHTYTTDYLHSVNIEEGMYELWQKDGESFMKTNKLYSAKFSDKEELRDTETNEKRTEPIS